MAKSMSLWDNSAWKLAVMLLTQIQEIVSRDIFGWFWVGNMIGVTTKWKQGNQRKYNRFLECSP